MDDLIKIIIASGVSGGAVGVVGFVLIVWRLKSYITVMEHDLATRNKQENERIWEAIKEKSSRIRVHEVEKRLAAIEEVGLNKVWRDGTTQQWTEIFDKLGKIADVLGALKTMPRAIEKVELKIDQHILNDK